MGCHVRTIWTTGAALAGLMAPSLAAAQQFAPTVAPQARTEARLSRFVGLESERHEPIARGAARGLERDIELDRRPTTFGVAYMPLSPRADAFVRLGYGSKAKAEGRGEDSWAYGAGAKYRMKGRSGVRADFTRQGLPRSDVKANIFSVGFQVRF